MRQISGAPRPGDDADARARRLWPSIPRVEPLQFRRIPLLVAALSFAAGIAIFHQTAAVSRPTLFFLVGVLALAALNVFALRSVPRIAIPVSCALWIAAGLWCAQIEPYPSPQTPLLSYADGLSRTMDARIVRIRELPRRDEAADADEDFDAELLDATGVTYSVDLAVSAIEQVTPDTSRMVPISGGVRATLITAAGDPLPTLRCGDRIEAPVRLHQPQRFRDPGVFQYADYLLQQDATGIAATTSIPAAKLSRTPSSAASAIEALRCRLYAAQSWASDRLVSFTASNANRRLPARLRFNSDDAATLNAMLFGDRTRLTHSLRLSFERTGSFHLFVVSGMHIAIVAAGLFWLARRLRLAPLAATCGAVALTTAYALLTGFGVPVQRALAMSALFLFARLLFRERFGLNSLGAAALVMLVWSPRVLFDTSFQMTFLALLAIFGVAAPLAEHRLVPWSFAAKDLGQRWKDVSVTPRLAQLRVMLRLWGSLLADAFGLPFTRLPGVLIRLLLWAAELALVGIVTEAVMALPMALYFHRATAFALPANMISVPLVGVLAPLGLITFGLALLSPWLALLPAAATALLLHAVQWLIGLIAHSNGADLRVPGPMLGRILGALLCILVCCWTARRARIWLLPSAALLTAAVLLVWWPHAPLSHAGKLEVTAIDVGQGDSILVVGPTGATMLIDSGGPTGAAARAENASGPAPFDTGEEVVSPYLWSRQIRSLDVLVLSHAHSDHMGGMPSVLRNFHPRELWVSIDPASQAYRDLLSEAVQLGVTVRHLHSPDALTWDGLAISVLAPSPAYANPGAPVNNDSLVLRMQYGRASVLLEGDAEAASEHAMLNAAASGSGFPIGPDTLLKVAHHGSRTSTTPEFLAAVDPSDAVISVGRGNTFGHPRPEIIERLAAARAHVFRTDEFGLSTFLLSRDGKISTLQDASNP